MGQSPCDVRRIELYSQFLHPQNLDAIFPTPHERLEGLGELGKNDHEGMGSEFGLQGIFISVRGKLSSSCTRKVSALRNMLPAILPVQELLIHRELGQAVCSVVHNIEHSRSHAGLGLSRNRTT